MDWDFSNSHIYRACKMIHRKRVFKSTKIIVFIFCLISLITFFGKFGVEDRIRNIIIAALVCIIAFFLLYIIYLPNYNKFKNRLSQFDKEKLESIDKEVSITELTYGTFYFLDNFLFLPTKAALIHYFEIGNIHFTYHKTNFVLDSVKVEVKCINKITYCVSLLCNPKDFNDAYFLTILNMKKNNLINKN